MFIKSFFEMLIKKKLGYFKWNGVLNDTLL